MKLEEYLKYFNFIQGAETYKIQSGDSINEISLLRVRASVAYARVANELGKIKDSIDLEFLRLRALGERSIKDCEMESESKINVGMEVSRRDLDSLLNGIEHFMNACSGRQRALEAEFRGTQRGEI